MKRPFIKATLFALTSIAALQAQSNETANDLTLLEDLPVEQRALAHQAVVDFLVAHPEYAGKIKVIAVDQNGVIYVLDENKVILSRLGQPSCVTTQADPCPQQDK